MYLDMTRIAGNVQSPAKYWASYPKCPHLAWSTHIVNLQVLRGPRLSTATLAVQLGVFCQRSILTARGVWAWAKWREEVLRKIGCSIWFAKSYKGGKWLTLWSDFACLLILLLCVYTLGLIQMYTWLTSTPTQHSLCHLSTSVLPISLLLRVNAL